MIASLKSLLFEYHFEMLFCIKIIIGVKIYKRNTNLKITDFPSQGYVVIKCIKYILNLCHKIYLHVLCNKEKVKLEESASS